MVFMMHLRAYEYCETFYLILLWEASTILNLVFKVFITYFNLVTEMINQSLNHRLVLMGHCL